MGQTSGLGKEGPVGGAQRRPLFQRDHVGMRGEDVLDQRGSRTRVTEQENVAHRGTLRLCRAHVRRRSRGDESGQDRFDESAMRRPPGKLRVMDCGEILFRARVGIVGHVRLAEPVVNVAEQAERNRAVAAGHVNCRDERHEKVASARWLAAFEVDGGERGGGDDVARLGGERGLGVGAALGKLTVAGSEPGEPGVRCRIARCQLEYVAIAIASRGHRTPGGEHEAPLEPGFGIIGSAADRGVAVEHGVAQAALAAQQCGLAGQRLGLAGIARENLVEQRRCPDRIAPIGAVPGDEVEKVRIAFAAGDPRLGLGSGSSKVGGHDTAFTLGGGISQSWGAG